MRLFIDTDIGDDIDDLLAISLAIRKNVDIVGITTVYRQAFERKKIAISLIRQMGVNIPVFAGYSEPISKSAKIMGKLNYGGGDESSYLITDNKPEEAVDYMIECVKKYGDELSIISIGAQTNIARAYEKDPETMSSVGQLVVMGGAFFAHNAEWNILCDPEAARIVSKSNMNITYMPWDITRHISIGGENVEYILKTEFQGGLRFVARNVRQWFENNRYAPLLHDPTALYYCLYPDWFSSDKIAVDIIADGRFAGATINMNTVVCSGDKSSYSKLNVVTCAKSDKIVEDFMSTLFDKKINMGEIKDEKKVV